METQLARREVTNPAKFGDKYEISAVRDRIVQMMPGAATAPNDVVWAAAQLAVAYRLDPFNGELYIMPTGAKKVGDNWVEQFRTHIGIKGQRKIARRRAEYAMNVRQMSAEEVKSLRRAEYMPEDIGVEVTILRLDLAQKFSKVGIKYSGCVGRGFWRVNAKMNKRDNKWEPDNIPNTWTAYEVAEKRAEVNALKKAYDMEFDIADPAMVDDDDVVDAIGYKIADYDRSRAPIAERKDYVVEEDGDVLFASEVQHRPAVVESDGAEDAQFVEREEPVKSKPSDIITDKSVGQPIVDFIVELRSKETPGAKIASKAQYEYVVGVLEAITGKNTHAELLACLFSRPVSSDSPISEAAAKHIFKCLGTKASRKDESGQWVKYDNPDYDESKVEFVSLIWKWYLGTEEPTGK